MDCRLCGQPTPEPPIEVRGQPFCCFGCSAVYRTFGDDAAVAHGPPEAMPVKSSDCRETFLHIDGMHCASCEILLERSAARIDGIRSLTCSYATGTAKVTYDPALVDPSRLPELLSPSGYRARLPGDRRPAEDEGPALLRLMTGVALAAVVMMLYLAFYYPTNLGLVPVQELEPIGWMAFYAAPRAMLVLTTLQILYVGAPILRGAWIGLRTGMLNMDNLLALAILAAYGYSLGQLLQGTHDLYFDVASVIVAVVTAGRYFERGAKRRATEELRRIVEAWTPRARVRRDGQLLDLGLDRLRPNDLMLVGQGEAIPVDGTVRAGGGAIDESLMTGEPFPVRRAPGEPVLGGSRVVEGQLEVEVGPRIESQMDNLARILWNLQSSSAGVQGLADRLARRFVPTVLVLAALVCGWLLMDGASPEAALLAGLATLIVSCPCTFGLAMPLTSAAAVSTALGHGILLTGADLFAKGTAVSQVAIDKTGTLSSGEIAVVEVLGLHQAVAYAAAVERLSVHPIAEAIARLDSSRSARDLEIHPGKGAMAWVDSRRVAVGSRSLFADLGWSIPVPLAAAAAESAAGEVVSYVGWEGAAVAAILTRDRQRPEWEQVVARLRRERRVVLVTGAEHPSGYEEAVDEFYVGVPPEAKAALVRRLKTRGRVAMIGDGSNDAPALAEADLGIAFGTPTALAAEAADVVIPGDRLERIFLAFDLIETARRRLRQNVGWALSYNAVAIPLAMTGLLNPLFAALAMSGSSLLVVWNSSRSLERASEPAAASMPTEAGLRAWSRLGSTS